VTNTWSNPDLLFEEYFANPVITPDNKLLVVFDNNLYESVRTTNGWTQPTIIDSAIFAQYELGPISITHDTLLCFIDLSTTLHTLYVSEFKDGHYQTPEPLPYPVNLRNYKIDNHFMAPDGSYILYSIHNFPGGKGASDLYLTFNRENHWTYPKSVGEHINTAVHDYGVYVSPDEKCLFYTRWELNNTVNMHWVSVDGLFDSLQTTNFTPYVLNPIPDQSILPGNNFDYSIPDSTFFDDDGNETLTLTAALANGSELPDSLYFNNETDGFSGKIINVVR